MQQPRPQLPSKGFVRIVTIILGLPSTLIGALWGLFFADNLGLPLAIGIILAIVSGVAGLLLAVFFPIAFVKFIQQQKVAPPPQRVLRLGALLGGLEGIVIGAIYGQWLGAVTGTVLGVFFGILVAKITWGIRYNIRLYIAALLLGSLVELAGGIAIGVLVKGVANDMQFAVVSAIILVLWAGQPVLQWAGRDSVFLQIKRRQRRLRTWLIRQHDGGSLEP